MTDFNMAINSTDLLERVASLRTHRKGNRRAPHKPLLLLYALGQLQLGIHELAFEDVEAVLEPMLSAYAPTVKGRHQPELPYWHLASDGLWQVHDAENFDRQANGFPRMSSLRKSTAGFPEHVVEALTSDPSVVERIVQHLLNEHFSPTLHEELLNAFGLSMRNSLQVAEASAAYETTKRRDPEFRENVLRAYEYRCAFSGFRAAMAGKYLGCEAAHVQWHCYDGPDSVANGIALEPTIHKLFDVGAWTLTDDRRILVSREFTGNDATVARIRERHGKSLGAPLAGESPVDVDFIRWHREPALGGVFREPALPL